MWSFVGVRARVFQGVLAVQAGLTVVALADVLLYLVARRSFLFVNVARTNLSESQLAVGEGAYSLLPGAEVVAGVFMLSYVLGVGYLLFYLIRKRSRDTLIFTGLVVNSAIVVNDTLVALSVFGGWYLMAFSKAFETVRIHRDIRTRSRERIERRLRQAEKMEAIGRIAGGIAHDFNNVLMAVGGRLDMAAEAVPADHAASEDLQSAKEGLETGRRLVRQVLDAARAEETKAEFVDVAAFLSDSTKFLCSMISPEVTLEIDAEPDVGGVMIARGQLTQVLMNLVINASDAMPHGGTIRVRAVQSNARTPFRSPAGRLGRARSQSEIVISVIDQGGGIPAEALEHVFEPFFTTKADQGGSGLGLATLYSIVRKAGGHVEVESKVGRGTRFDVSLPRCQG
jgi:signal transduction histidine kinase